MRVALTFDTEPGQDTSGDDGAERILGILVSHGVRATFFLQGEWAELHPDLAARLTAEGHRVGNHTHSHALPGAIGEDVLREEIARAEGVIERTTGQSPRPYFRCPQNSGAFDEDVRARISEAGYRQTGWSFDSLDWQEGRTAEAIAATVVAGVKTHGDGSVVLLHTWPAATAEALPLILDALAGRGVEFVTLDELDAESLPVACVQPSAARPRGHHLAKSTLWGLAAKFATVAANFLIGVIIARALGPVGKGAYALVLQIVGVLVVALGLGLGTSNIYFVASRKAPAKTVTANSLWLLAATGVLATAVCMLFIAGPFAPDPPYSFAMAVAASALFVFTTLFTWLGAVAVGLSGLKPRAIAGICSVSVVLAGVVVLSRLELLSALFVIALGVVGQALASLVVLAFERGKMLSLRPSLHTLRSMLGYSAKSYVVELVNYVHLRLDILLLGWLTTTATVGVYSVGVSLAEIARYVPSVVGAALFARASGVARDEGSALSARMSRLTVLLVAASVVVFGALAPVAVPRVFGEAFSDATRIFLVLLPGTAAMSISEVPSSYLFSRQIIYWRASAAMVALNVVLNLIMIPRLGAVGAALASSVTYTLLAGIILYLMKRESGLSYREILVPSVRDVRAALRVLLAYVRR
ncbi:MAG: polysaccharide deacetylase family protein [Coriobacteriia bacterium]|jgi:O-antigen/teichoic acid export membrane protein/peptidoglycan/xylan/chitin deacetylase (PgdA/CDA1 family)|nr:polysaccharide deacetylase family protein [Coriobacteriia bacterium]